MTLGKKIAALRREKRITQEELSERLNISPQAVSKWENDQSYPDIALLPKIADIFRVTTDELFARSSAKETAMLPEAHAKNMDDMIFKIIVNSSDGDKVRVNLPLPLIKLGLEIGLKLPEVTNRRTLGDIDFASLFRLVERGVVGKLVEVESKDGDLVEIVVE